MAAEHLLPPGCMQVQDARVLVLDCPELVERHQLIAHYAETEAGLLFCQHCHTHCSLSETSHGESSGMGW